MPTILEAAGIQAPKVVDGIPQAPIEGVSMVYTFDKANADAPSKHHTQYFEMFGDHALYNDGWIASTKVIRPPWENFGPADLDPAGLPWELYDLTKDWTQDQDVADKYPEKLKELEGPLLGRGGQVPGSAVGRVDRDPIRHAAAQRYGWPQRVHLLRRDDRHAER